MVSFTSIDSFGIPAPQNKIIDHEAPKSYQPLTQEQSHAGCTDSTVSTPRTPPNATPDWALEDIDSAGAISERGGIVTLPQYTPNCAACCVSQTLLEGVSPEYDTSRPPSYCSFWGHYPSFEGPDVTRDRYSGDLDPPLSASDSSQPQSRVTKSTDFLDTVL